MTATYLRSCPGCGAQLAPVVLGPDSAPWLCVICVRGWWVAELSQAARAGWVQSLRSFSWPATRGAVAAGVEAELAAAAGRGSSVLAEQLPLLSAAQLQQLAAAVPKSSPFAAQVAAAANAKAAA